MRLTLVICWHLTALGPVSRQIIIMVMATGISTGKLIKTKKKQNKEYKASLFAIGNRNGNNAGG